MDKVLSVEQKHLSGIIDKIKQRIDYMKRSKPFPEVNQYSTVRDYKDQDDLRYMKRCNAEADKETTELTQHLDEPYFGRMDLKSGRTNNKMYIGKKGLYLDSELLVYDWRSPIAARFYKKDEVEFNHDGTGYSLLLRRKYDIRKSVLHTYQDEYVFGAEVSAFGITDPFLLEILRQKRDEHKLTDIIKTIQNNQNEIIRYSGKNNFVVQGCAGSGKTMVMLHRLSHLKFNNPNSDLSKIKIITPNEKFNVFINELSEELELDKIERLSVEQYYRALLMRYDQAKWNNTKISSDSDLTNEFLQLIYSEDFHTLCKDRYDAFFRELPVALNYDRILDIKNKYDLDIRELNTQTRNNAAIEAYQYVILRILDIHKERKNKIDRVKRRLDSAKDKYRKTLTKNDMTVFQAVYYEKQLENYGRLISQWRLLLEAGDTERPRVKEAFESILNEIDALMLESESRTSGGDEELKNEIDAISAELDGLLEATLTDEEYQVVKFALDICNAYNAEHVFKITFGKPVNEASPKHEVKPGQVYRYDLVLWLHFYSLFFGRSAGGDRFLNIDEGQDLSVIEYNLLNSVNGGDVIFNIYGDTNQLITPWRGISDWSLLKFIGKKYVLKENYRNTVEITDFCNKEFGHMATAIGVSGEKVRSVTMANLVKELAIRVEDFRNNRCAVIANKKEDIKDIIKDRKISVLSVEESKGLEFDIVYVHVKNMSVNQTYIAYTRALSELVLIEG